MTSVLRRYAQLEPRTKYFALLSDCSGYTLNSNAISGPLMDVSSFVATYTNTINFLTPLSNLLLDLGRSITVYNPAIPGSPHIAVFRQVMLVNGPGIEGISGTKAYICTWSDGNTTYEAATVARTG